MSQKTRPQRHIPQRTCVACRTVRPKRELLRVVRTPEGHVTVDETGKRNGRGAYLCPRNACWEKALTTGLLNRALRTNLKADVKAKLTDYAANF